MLLSKKLLAFTGRPYWYVYFVGILVLVGSGYAWTTRVYLNPRNVFWGMVKQSLDTRAVTTEITQSAEGQSLKQLLQLDLGSTPRARYFTSITQGGSEVKTERFGTPEADYVRYLGIKMSDKDAQGKPLNVSKLVNVWSKTANTATTGKPQLGDSELMVQAIMGTGLGSNPIPVGAVSAKQRADLLKEMQDNKMYQVSFTSKDVIRTHKDGRLLYTYSIKVQPVPYVHVEQQFASALGIHGLDDVNPNDYSGYQAISAKITVDAMSRRLVSVDNGQGYVQKYEAYGLPITAQTPTHTISETELKKRLTELQPTD